jgi:hypothetical protein
MIAMMDLERALNILGHRDEEIPCARSVRRAYLKQALKIHPDKQHTTEGRKASTAIDEILKRAFEGMDVEDDLAALGVFRPDPMFGVDHRVSFERHPPREHHIDPELLQEMIEKLLEPDGDTSCSNESDY